jgi:hypothetical protein
VSSSLYNVNGVAGEVIHALYVWEHTPNVARFVTTPGGDRSLWHKQERLFIHSSSVNAKTSSAFAVVLLLSTRSLVRPIELVVSTTCFVHPFSDDLRSRCQAYGAQVCLDEWIELGIAAKTGVMFREPESK